MILSSFFLALPRAFLSNMRIFLYNYMSSVKELEREVDSDLLEPIHEKLQEIRDEPDEAE